MVSLEPFCPLYERTLQATGERMHEENLRGIDQTSSGEFPLRLRFRYFLLRQN